jgi:hypothetical protein
VSAETWAVVLSTAIPLVVIVGALWSVVAFVFQPRLKDTIESTIRSTVNGKIDRVEAKVDRIQADAEKRFRDVDLRDNEIHTRFEVQIERVSHLADEIERLRG